MSWNRDLNPRPNHWIFDFVLHQKPQYSKRLYFEEYHLVQVIEYPPLPIINIYRVYIDKYERHHYFTFSNFETIQAFCRSARTYSIHNSKILRNTSFSRCEVRQLVYGDRLADKLIYCLPQHFTPKRSHGI